MDGEDLVFNLRAIINEYKTKEIKSISIQQLERHIDYAEKHAAQCFDHKKMKHEKHLEAYRAVISTGANAIKSALITNGASAIALLAFLPRIPSTEFDINIIFLTYALQSFLVGVSLAALGSGFAYFTNRSYLEFKKLFWGHSLNVVSVILIFTSYISFVVGIYYSAKALGMF
jgi:hypothetical protein|tara:strand:+ start:1040 stop:1558 length:519 start_codon:yes stop_codon:yes gene_type:complete